MTENIVGIIIKILTYIFVILLFIWLFVRMRNIGFTIFADQAKDAPQTSVEAVLTVEDGESILNIAKDLSEQEIIENPYLFTISLHCMNGYEDIRSGDYVISSAEKPSEILTKLTQEGEENE